MTDYKHAPPPTPTRLVIGPLELVPLDSEDTDYDIPAVRPPLGAAAPSTPEALKCITPETTSLKIDSTIRDLVAGTQPRIPGLPTDSAARKEFPMGTGFVDYFAAAMAEVAHVSWIGNQKHNPGQPLHHARGKSMDHDDCVVRHFSERGGWDRFEWTDQAGVKQVRWVLHSAYLAWRAMATLQQECEDLGAPKARAAR